jgi:hypothetical protein
MTVVQVDDAAAPAAAGASVAGNGSGARVAAGDARGYLGDVCCRTPLTGSIMTPSITDSMTATPYGTPDLTELRNLMRKPNSSLMMSFNEDAYPGMAPDRFRGEAVVFLSTRAFIRRTASRRSAARRAPGGIN